ncbi:G-type lectin S-receptor-like serine/threonine-protein kinase At2g19130 [Impatiens glandulifera]|uniref:G-type lectin S-receptor-like serine/threonine-protein kinase At2g19130 n=1 Tax=Impatiens glandulifera TaxID=253017 RepID=UPI001FB0A56A|nr:G-type lectin S-receptor-like serine/threonine-protein kinase At2g19130 [Impatiens glandulifera]
MCIRKNHSFFFFVLLCFFCSQYRLSHGANHTLSVNQTLSGDQTIVSAGGIFALGFFRPGKDSNKNYIGIWYNNLPITQTVVWVANKDNPISDRYSSQLRILNGNLVLLNESQTSIWSTNISSSSSSPVEAILGDDGNFALKDMSNSTVWQSFDYPVHTWLPGSKLSYNKLTKTHQILTSWKNSEDPSDGLFSLELDEKNSQYLSRWNRSKQYWTSGPWDGKIFSLVPEMRADFLFNFSYVNNVNESYFTFKMYDPKGISRFFMDVAGQIRVVSWVQGVGWNLFWNQPRTQCEVYALCGGNGACNEITPPFCNCLDGFHPKSQDDWDLNDFSGGCVRKFDLQCGNINNKRKDGFKLFTNMRLPENPRSLSNETDIGTCASSCLNDCSCTAYALDNNVCSVWNTELLNLQTLAQNNGNGRSIYIRLSAQEFSSGKRSFGTIIGAVVGSVAAVILVSVIVWCKKKRSVGMSKVEGSLISFVYRDLQNATKNFSEKLGGGGFGSVFKGTLPDSTLIAVKKLDSISQGEKQFRTEVSTIGTVQHVNLVRLRGFCSEGKEKLLVYEYMPNGSLDSILFHPKDSKSGLDWKTRYQVAIGMARGLSYLHEKCRDCIVHCDIKPENILLDSGFCPKVADFGLAKLIGRDFSRVLTTLRGTRGYLAPEWISGVAITAKADVYSYGMMLFELISGRRNSDPSEDGKVKFFPTWAANLAIEGGDILSLLDPRLDRESAEAEEVMRICRVACWCIQDEEGHRPTMGQVVQILEGVLDVEPCPVPRALQVIVENEENIVFFTESSSSSSSNKTSQIQSISSSVSAASKS